MTHFAVDPSEVMAQLEGRAAGVVAGVARFREGRDGGEAGMTAPVTLVPPSTGSPSPPGRPVEVVPGVWSLDQARHHLGPSTPDHLLHAVLQEAALSGRPVRVHAPDMPLLLRITLCGLDHGFAVVFSLHPDGDRADITVHPL